MSGAPAICDVLVVGSGAGGLATAVVAAFHGLEVLVVEKAPVLGGTTRLVRRLALDPAQPPGSARRASSRTRPSRAAISRASSAARPMTRASPCSCANGPEMVRFFEAETAVAFIDGNRVPDFHATPGHADRRPVGRRRAL